MTSKLVRKEIGGHPMGNLILRLFKDETGVTAIEYALCSAGITVIIIAGASAVGTNLIGIFTAIRTAMAG
jgi:pilus assembly protein Flp/PilA